MNTDNKKSNKKEFQLDSEEYTDQEEEINEPSDNLVKLWSNVEYFYNFEIKSG